MDAEIESTECSSAVIPYEGTEVSSPISSLSQEDILEDISTYEKDVSGSVNPNSDHSDIDDTSVDCEQDTNTAEVNDPQHASFNESTISSYDISKAVQLIKENKEFNRY